MSPGVSPIRAKASGRAATSGAGRYLGAWAVHLAGVAAGAVGLFMYTAWADALRWNRIPTWGQWLEAMDRQWRHGLIALLGQNWDWATLIQDVLLPIASTAMVFELAFIVVAWIVMSWGARPERLRTSFGRALRRLWWITPALAGLVLIVLGMIVAVTHALGLTVFFSSVFAPNSSRAWPFWVGRGLIYGGALAASVGAIGVVLAAVGAGRWRARCRWPAVCEACGYALTGLMGREACPECGRPLAGSIGETHRAGIAWPKGLKPRVRQWGRLTWQAVCRPRALGARVRLYTPARGHRGFLMVTLGLGATMAMGFPWIAAATEMWVRGLRWRPGSNLFDVLLIGAVLSVLVVVIFLALVLGGAGGYARTIGRKFVPSAKGTSAGEGPNLMPGALQAACYASPLLLVWLAANMVYLWMLIATQGELFNFLGWWGLIDHGYEPTVAVYVALGLNLAGLVWWAVVLGRAVRAMRYANR